MHMMNITLNNRNLRILLISILPLILLTACPFSPSVVDKKASLGIQVRDADTNLEIDGIQVDLLVEGQAFQRDDEIYSFATDQSGRVQFDGLPKKGFTIEVPETETRMKFDTTYYEGSFTAKDFNELVITLERKKTTFVGTVLDDEDNRPIEGAQLELVPGNYFAQSDERGRFELKATKINKNFQYTLTISKIPGYYSNSIDIPEPKLNNENNLRSIMLRRTPGWEPEIINEGEINIEKKRGPRRIKIG
jgi:hypothetical protein